MVKIQKSFLEPDADPDNHKNYAPSSFGQV